MKIFPNGKNKDEASLPELPKILKILPNETNVLFPYMVLPFVVTDQNAKKLVEDAVSSDRIIGIFTTKTSSDNAKQSTLYTIGSAGIILRMLRIPDGSLQVITQGLQRIVLKRITQDRPYYKAEIETLEETFEKSIEFEGMLRTAITQFHEIIEHAPYLPPEMKMIIDNLEQPSQQIDFMASNLNLKKEEQQQLLEQLDLTKRL
jgi:ATP-dependent Lon protease